MENNTPVPGISEDKTKQSPLDIPGPDKPMREAEDNDPLVKKAQNEQDDMPNRDEDEFTDQHLRTPKVHPDIEEPAHKEEK